MRASDIEKVAAGLMAACPGSYPGGGPNTRQGWDMWRACVYEIGKAIAGSTRDFRSGRWEELTDPERRKPSELSSDYRANEGN